MTRPGKAVETAAIWTPWKNERIEKPTNEVRFFHPYHSAWETGSRCSLVSHSYTPLLLLDTQTDSIRPASRGPGIERSGQPMPSSRAYSTPAPGSRPYSLSTEGFTRD